MIRHSQIDEIPQMMKLIKQAQMYFKNNAIDQWQDGYPNEKQLLEDIHKNQSYVYVENSVIATMYFAIENDISYDYIEGSWLTSNSTYAVIHRIVVDTNFKGQGLAKKLLDYAIRQCLSHDVYSIRIDTHKDNLSMQSFLIKNGFQYCGVIYLESGASRIAFEKLLNK